MEEIASDAPETRSADIVAENIQHLRALFPEVFSEGKVDFEVLRANPRRRVGRPRREVRPQLARENDALVNSP